MMDLKQNRSNRPCHVFNKSGNASYAERTLTGRGRHRWTSIRPPGRGVQQTQPCCHGRATTKKLYNGNGRYGGIMMYTTASSFYLYHCSVTIATTRYRLHHHRDNMMAVHLDVVRVNSKPNVSKQVVVSCPACSPQLYSSVVCPRRPLPDWWGTMLSPNEIIVRHSSTLRMYLVGTTRTIHQNVRDLHVTTFLRST